MEGPGFVMLSDSVKASLEINRITLPSSLWKLRQPGCEVVVCLVFISRGCPGSFRRPQGQGWRGNIKIRLRERQGEGHHPFALRSPALELPLLREAQLSRKNLLACCCGHEAYVQWLLTRGPCRPRREPVSRQGHPQE